MGQHTARCSPLLDPRAWLASLGFWILLILLMFGTDSVQHVVDGRSVPIASWAMLRMLLPSFGPFVVATPLLLHLAPRLSALRGTAFWWRSLAIVLTLAIAHAAIAWFGEWRIQYLLMGALTYVFYYGAILGVALTLEQRSQARIRERDLLAMQLRALRSQLQPHFLFNTLQAIGATAPRDGALAARMTALLGDLLRQTLRERDGDLVSLAEEQTLLQPYLQLQQLRFSDRLRVEVDVPAELLGAAVPDLLLQPLVENALQHGIEQRPGAGTVRIVAKRAAQSLLLEVHDDGQGLARATDELRVGTGLGATRERLRALFGKDASVELRSNDHGGTTATVRLPYLEVRRAA